METYFHSDSRIKQWSEKIIEKIFLVCLLKGTESESDCEFTKGRQLVVNIILLLTDISSLPPSAVFEATIQLLEQQLPDQRIIDNYPDFYQVMENMVQEGIAAVADNLTTIETNKLDIEPNTISNTTNTIYQEETSKIQTFSDIDLCIPEYLDIPVLAAVTDLTFPKKLQVTPIRVDSNLTVIDDLDSNIKRNTVENTFSIRNISLNSFKETLIKPTEQLKTLEPEFLKNLSKELSLSNNRVKRSSQVPEEATRLAIVLQQIFPNTTAKWNICLGEYKFLVQIEDLLIYLETLSEGNRVVEEMKKQGWQIVVCQAEDLRFPRRLERAIHRILKNKV